jgi:predicted nucleotide-binding protein
MSDAIYGDFLRKYNNKKLPSSDMMEKILTAEWSIPSEHAAECAERIVVNGRFAGVIRDISGSPHVMVDVGREAAVGEQISSERDDGVPEGDELYRSSDKDRIQPSPEGESAKERLGPEPKAILICHGKNKKPVEELQRILSGMKIAHKVAINEPNKGRPISQKIKDLMKECNSAILIFTKDELFFDKDEEEIWRPSENVIHELGAASFAYEDKIVIFKEEGLILPSNFKDIGYISFEPDSLESKAMDLIKELVAFGLLKVEPA